VRDIERDRVTVKEAAKRLGISESGVRKRVQREQIESARGADGRLFVYLDNSETETDQVRDYVRDPVRDRYIERLEAEIDFLRDQVRRQQEITAAQAVTMRQLSAAAEEPAEAAETVEEEPEGTSPRSAAGDARTATQRPQGGTLRGLRRRILGW
jgi:predicted ArsR family transcriptional regulator